MDSIVETLSIIYDSISKLDDRYLVVGINGAFGLYDTDTNSIVIQTKYTEPAYITGTIIVFNSLDSSKTVVFNKDTGCKVELDGFYKFGSTVNGLTTLFKFKTYYGSNRLGVVLRTDTCEVILEESYIDIVQPQQTHGIRLTVILGDSLLWLSKYNCKPVNRVINIMDDFSIKRGVDGR